LEFFIGGLVLFKKKQKWIPREIDIEGFKRDLEKERDIEWSDSLLERMSVSGDLSGSPYYHWHWKDEYVANLVIWPKNETELVEVVKLAHTYNVPITIRGGGTNYFGSSVPTMGDTVLDLKTMDNFELNENAREITVQPGVVFKNLLDYLKEKSVELPSYPSSALSATIGGWLNTMGSIGIGTYKNGALSNYILELKVITSEGKINHLKETEAIKEFTGKYGILGIITEIKIRLVKKTKKYPYLFGVKKLSKVRKILNNLSKNENIYHLSFFDDNYFQRLYPEKQDFKYYLFLMIKGSEAKTNPSKSKSIKMIKNSGGTFLGKPISEKYHQNLLKDEMRLKKDIPVLLLQSLNINIQYIEEIIMKFKQLSNERNLNECVSGIVGIRNFIRLNLFTLTDNDLIIHFLSSKGILHRIVKFVYTYDMGRIYDYGLYNGIYLEKYESEKRKKFRELKKKYDPIGIFNPWKLIKVNTSFTRINTIFELNLLWRYLAAKLGIAKNIQKSTNQLKINQ
jgi:glycolate oxidase